MSIRFLRLRLFFVYLLSVHGSLHVLFAYGQPPTRTVVGWLIGLAAATLIGQALESRVSTMIERQWRGRILGAVWIAYGGILILTVLGITNGSMSGIPLLLVCQPCFLIFAGFGRGHIGAVRNAVILSAVAAAPGGMIAILSVAGCLLLLPFFLTLDHYARKMLQYPVDRGPSVARALGHALVPALLPAAAAVAYGLLFGADAYHRVPRPQGPPPDSAALWAAYRDLMIAVFVGGFVFYLVLRILFHQRRDVGATRIQVPEVARGAMELRAMPKPPPESAYSGFRGKIVKLYVKFVAEASRLGRRKRPDHTPAEYASQFVEPIGILTRLFERARYGADDLTDAEVAAARDASEQVLSSLRPPR